MTEGIIIAVLSMVGTLAGAYLANRKSSALIAYRLDTPAPTRRAPGRPPEPALNTGRRK